jgi:hypothetical protein
VLFWPSFIFTNGSKNQAVGHAIWKFISKVFISGIEHCEKQWNIVKILEMWKEKSIRTIPSRPSLVTMPIALVKFTF